MNEVRGQNLIQSVCRAAAILRCFNEKQELGITEISNIVGLHKSTTSGIIHTLCAENFLEKNNSTGKYRVGLDIFRLAYNSQVELNKLCDPYLDELLYNTGETVNLAVRDGASIVYVAKKESSHSMRISTRVGMRLPIYCTAIGKAILSLMDNEKVAEILKTIELKPFTENTIISLDKLLIELDEIRAEKVAYDREELEYGLICIAAPLYNKNEVPLGALSVSGPSMRMESERTEMIKQKLCKVANDLRIELYRVVST